MDYAHHMNTQWQGLQYLSQVMATSQLAFLVNLWAIHIQIYMHGNICHSK